METLKTLAKRLSFAFIRRQKQAGHISSQGIIAQKQSPGAMGGRSRLPENKHALSGAYAVG